MFISYDLYLSHYFFQSRCKKSDAKEEDIIRSGEMT